MTTASTITPDAAWVADLTARTGIEPLFGRAHELYADDGSCLVCGSLNPAEHDEPCESADGTILLPPQDLILARADAERDFASQAERTVAPGICTGCEAPAAELLPWTPAERLCLRCVDFQLDLLAKAIAEGDGQTVNLVKVRWV